MKELESNYWNTGNSYLRNENFFCFWETDDQKYAVVYDNIVEYSLMKFISSIEIWQNKVKPELIFKSENEIFEFQFKRSCYYLEKSGLLVMLTTCIPSYQMCYMVMDLKQKLFTKIDCINYDLCENNKGTIYLEPNYRYFYPQRNNKEEFEILKGMLFNPQKLIWFSANEFIRYCQLETATPKKSVQSA
ncbi:hypothetical protein BH11BAC7_BH11BAC7_18560 [soil metagenome]